MSLMSRHLPLNPGGKCQNQMSGNPGKGQTRNRHETDARDRTPNQAQVEKRKSTSASRESRKAPLHTPRELRNNRFVLVRLWPAAE